MNRALFYSLIESGSLLRDYSKLMEANIPVWQKGTKQANLHGHYVVPDAELAELTKTHATDPGGFKRAVTKGKGRVYVGPDQKTPIPHPTEGRLAGAEVAKIRSAYDKTNPGRVVKVAKGLKKQFGKFSNKVTDAVEHYGNAAKDSGVVKNLFKYGIPTVAGAIVGGGLTANALRKTPGVKAAMEWGPYIEHAKKYGPYALAAGGGLLAAHALSNND